MKEKIKATWSLITVKAALAAAALAAVSLYLPWYTNGTLNQSLMQRVGENPDYYIGAVPVILAGILLTVIFFLTNHPKLTLIGDVAMAVMYLAFTVMEIAGYNDVRLAMGAYLYLTAMAVLIVCAFATRKIRKEK